MRINSVKDFINTKYSTKDLLYQKFGLEVEIEKSFKCPFHDDSTASARLYDDNKFYCYGCGKQFTPYKILIKIGVSHKKLEQLVPVDFKARYDSHVVNQQIIIDSAKYLSSVFINDNDIIDLVENWSKFYNSDIWRNTIAI